MLPQFIFIHATGAFELAVNPRGPVVQREMLRYRRHAPHDATY